MTVPDGGTPAEACVLAAQASGINANVQGTHPAAVKQRVRYSAFRAGYEAGAARATAAERDRIRQLAIDHNAVADPCYAETPFADLLAAAPSGVTTHAEAPDSVPKVTGPETSPQAVSDDHSAAQHHPCQCQECT